MAENGYGDRRTPFASSPPEVHDWWAWAEESGLRPADLARQSEYFDTAVSGLPEEVQGVLRSRMAAVMQAKASVLDSQTKDAPTLSALRTLSWQQALADTDSDVRNQVLTAVAELEQKGQQ